MKAGYAEIDITPEEPLFLAGFAEPKGRLGESIDSPLIAQALLLEDAEEHKLLLLAFDSVACDAEWAEHVCQTVAQNLSIPRKSVFINVSHTHCAPQIRLNLSIPAALEYRNSLQSTLIELATTAANTVRPAKFALTEAINSQVTCRRRWSPEGWLNAPNPQLEPVRQTPMLDIVWDDGERLLVPTVAGHPTTASDPVYDSHYHGILRQLFAPQAKILVLSGFSGDSKMTTPDRQTQSWIRDRKTDVRIIAHRLAADLMESFQYLEPVTLSLASFSTSGELPRWENAPAQMPPEEAGNHLAAYLANPSLPIPSSTPPVPFYASIHKITKDHFWVALSGEVCGGYAEILQDTLSKILPEKSFAFIGYCHCASGYIPTAKILFEGGYEGKNSFAPKPPLHPSSEKIVANLVDQCAKHFHKT